MDVRRGYWPGDLVCNSEGGPLDPRGEIGTLILMIYDGRAIFTEAMDWDGKHEGTWRFGLSTPRENGLLGYDAVGKYWVSWLGFPADHPSPPAIPPYIQGYADAFNG